MKHPRSWLSAVSFAQCAFAAVLPAGAELPDDEMDDEMDDSACDESSARIRRWPAVDTRLLAAKTPQWLRSLTLHHQRYQNKHSDNSLSDSKLPKLATMSGDAQSHDECPLDGAVGETSESENNNNDHSPRWPRRSTAAQRFAKLSRIALPPLGAHQARPALLDASLSPAGSWLLPIIPSAHRRKAYKGNIKEQHKQFSAQTDRLPPIASPSPSGPSLSAPLPSNKGLMELCGSSPAKARDETPEKRHPIGTPLVAVHRAKSRRGDVTQRLEENEKLARVAPGAWDGSAQDAAREKSHAHLRRDSSSSSGGRAHADATAGHCEEALASASRQVASDPGSASLPRLTASRSGGSAGPPVGRRPPSDHQATPVLPAGRRSRDPASSERAPLPGVSPPQSSAAVRSNKQGRRRLPAVRWTIEWTDEQIGPAVHQAADSPIETTTTTLSATDADGPEPPVVVMASPSASRRSTDRQFRSAGRVRRSPPPHSAHRPDDTAERRTPRSRSPPVPAVLARQRAQTAHPSLSPKSSASNDPASIQSSERKLKQEEEEEEQDDEIIDSIQLHDLELNDSSPERSSPGRSIKQPSSNGTAAATNDDDEEGEHRDDSASPGNNLQPNDQLSRTSSIELIKKLLNNNQLDEAEDAELVPASSPTFRRPPSERLVYHEENCLPNVVQDPDDRPAFVGSGQSRFVDYSMQFDDEDEAFGKGRNLTTSQERVLAEEEYEIDDGVNFVSELRAPHHYPTANSTTSSPSKSAVRLGPKSRSLASFAGRNSPDDSARRQRSLPVRRLDSSSERANNGPKRTAVMPSCRKPTAAVRTHSPPVTNFKAPPDTLDPRIGLQMALKGINSAEWEDKMEGLRRLNELLTGYSENLTHETHTIALSLLVEVRNLRSQVSRAAIQCLGKMFKHCSKHMDQDLDRSVSLLLNKTSDTNRFIREDAHSALVNVTEYVSAPKAIVVITAEGLTHKNGTVRAEAAKLLAAIVVRLGPAKTLCGAKDVTERLLPAAAHFIQDGSLEARGQAKIMFSVMIKDPVFDKALVKYLSPAVIRNIQRTLDVLRKNPQQF